MSKKLKNKIKRRKNFLPPLLLAVIFWGIWGWFIYSYPPETNSLIFIFYILLFLATFFTLALAFANSKMGIVTAIWFIFILVFRYFKIGNALNVGLLTVIFFLLLVHFSRKIND